MTGGMSALLELRESTVQLLDQYLEAFDGSDDEPEFRHGDQTVRRLTALGIRHFLEAVDDHLRDREGIEGAGVDEGRVVRRATEGVGRLGNPITRGVMATVFPDGRVAYVAKTAAAADWMAL